MATSNTMYFLSATISALTLHEFVLRRVEVDHLALPILAVSTALFWLATYHSGLVFAISLAASFWAPLTAWILLYRAFWHPLRHIPGPFGARLSKLWAVKKTWETDWHYHKVLVELQKEYGDYVRTGPREVTIFDPAAVLPMYGASSKTEKGPFYDCLEKSLHLNRDKPWHRRRRRIWDNGMKESLSDFAPRVEEFTDQLLVRLREDAGKPVPLREYCAYYSYDVMSALAFGNPMGFIQGDAAEVADRILSTFAKGLSAMGLLSHMPWMLKALTLLTSQTGPLKEWRDWSVSQMHTRMAMENPKPDFASHLISHTPNDAPLLYGESRLLVTAGSETTSTALNFIFMQLATHPHHLHAVRAEVLAAIQNTDTDNDDDNNNGNQDSHSAGTGFDSTKLSPFLDAVIDESMRLWPSIFFGSQRTTPTAGLCINNHFIPRDTIVMTAPYATNRDARNFVLPDAFAPERWTTRPDMVLDDRAFVPFGTGPYSCAGKALARMELRSVVGRVVAEFDVVLPEGFVGEAYWGRVRDRLTAGPPHQMLRFVGVGG